MSRPRPNAYRDSWCGEVLADRVGERVRVAGWVHRRRDHGGLVFVDLRDRTGIVQVVFNPEEAPEAHARAHELRSEWVISVARRSRAALARRPINRDLPTGEVEIRVTEVDVLAEAETPPFPLDEETEVDEALRLRYRYLDLRREPMQRRSRCGTRSTGRSASISTPQGFFEIETPILTRSTPEGARDFVVPSRMQRGSFYALPQSPQLFKQLLMIAGYERYFQIARCFRDEDLRADRQPEFTQLDMEMSFVTEEDVIAVYRGRARAPPSRPAAWSWHRRSRASTYDEAMPRFGTDRPDLRFGLEIRDLGDALRGNRVQGLPRRARAAAAWCAGSTPARASCRARSWTG